MTSNREILLDHFITATVNEMVENIYLTSEDRIEIENLPYRALSIMNDRMVEEYLEALEEGASLAVRMGDKFTQIVLK